jgi:catechol 2,3-dioxygenase-like lactoylglutathione lyase family enzyme
MNAPGLDARTSIRVARPTGHLEEVVRFYTEGLGFTRLDSFEDHAGFDGVMVGLPGADWHLEFTRRRGQLEPGAPGEENLLVLYLPDAATWRAAVNGMRAAGYESVTSANPYWDRQGLTFEDPDGYRVVLQNASWPA